MRSREAREEASLQQGEAASLESEVSRLQTLSGDLEQQLAEARAREQQAIDKLSKMKVDNNSLTDKLERSGVLMVELREAVAQAKSFAVEEFKSLSDFLGAVEDVASKYFGEGFDYVNGSLVAIIPTSLSSPHRL